MFDDDDYRYKIEKLKSNLDMLVRLNTFEADRVSGHSDMSNGIIVQNFKNKQSSADEAMDMILSLPIINVSQLMFQSLQVPNLEME